MMAIKWWKSRKGVKDIKGWAKFAMEELVKLKPSHDTADLIYESPPYTWHKVTAQKEEPPILPETVANLTNKLLANTASTSSLNSLTMLDETSLEYMDH